MKKSWIVAAGHRGAGRGRFDRFRRGRGDLPCLLAVLLSAIVLGLHACDDGPVELPAVQIELTPDTLTLRTGESAQLTAVVQNARNVAVSFSTSNAAVATVTSTGLVTGVGGGTAVIAAVSRADPTKRDSSRVTVLPPPEIQVAVSPDSLALEAGQSLRLTATVTGSGNTSVRWSSTAPGVATVDSTGLVVGVAQGQAQIVAAARADTTKRATARVTVHPARRAAIAIVSITRILPGGGEVAVDPSNVVGRLKLTLNVDTEPGAVSRVETILDGRAICSQPIGSGSSPDARQAVELVCVFDTGEFNRTTGAPTYLNGQRAVVAQLVAPAGAVVASTSTNLRFNNPDGFLARVTTSGAVATNPGTGVQWTSGDVVVALVPVMFSGANVARVTVQIGVPSAAPLATQTDATREDGFSVVFPNDPNRQGNLAGIEAQNLTPTVAGAVTTDGRTVDLRGWTRGIVNNDLPPGETPPVTLNLDNQAPVLPAGRSFVLPTQSVVAEPYAQLPCCSGNWVGPAFQFASALPTPIDQGVGGVTSLFQVGTAAEGFGSPQTVTSAGELTPTLTNGVYVTRTVLRDGLGNERRLALAPDGAKNNTQTVIAGQLYATFGVDAGAPTVVFAAASAGDQEVDATGTRSFVLEGSDQRSHFDTEWAPAKLVRMVPASLHTPADLCRRGVRNTSTSGECRPVLTNGTINITAGTALEGYWRLTAWAWDRAGNVSPDSLVRVVLVDRTSPQVGAISHAPALTGGTVQTFQATAQDNIDLWVAWLWIGYGRVVSLRAEGQVGLGDRFTTPDQFTTAAPLTATVSFVRNVETTTEAGQPSGNIVPANTANFWVFDAAGNLGQLQADIRRAVTAGTASFAAAAVSSLDVALPEGSVVCNGARGACSSAPTTLAVQAVARVVVGAADPFQRVVFYYIDPFNRLSVPLEEATTAEVSDEGSTRTFVFRGLIRGNPLSNLSDQTVPVFALGVNSAGDALKSGNRDIRVTTN